MDHIAEYKKLLQSNPQPPSNLKGDGIIYGLFENNPRTNVAMGINLRILRELFNWQGRVQVWHVGSHPEICKNNEIEFIDAREVRNKHGGEIRSWTLKSFAIRHSGLAKIQWMDWDAYLIKNPHPLFAELISSFNNLLGPY